MANFIKHTKCEYCGSSDANALYDDGSSHCFSCRKTIGSDGYKSEAKESVVRKYVRKDEQVQTTKVSKPVITEEQKNEIKEQTTLKCYGYRGISDSITQYFRVRHSIDDRDDVISQYYPVTQEGQLTGYKVRDNPKDFRSIGRTGAECELFGQFLFNRGGKYLIITEGEIDALSAYQMMKAYADARNSPFETAVVSPTTGANSSRQLANNYRFFDSFENIILCYDNDKVGKEAAIEAVKVLPKGKVKMMNLKYKDANEYLENNAGDQFVRDFYNAETYTPVGVLGSGQLYEKILQQAQIARVAFPPFMNQLNDMLVGGIPLGHIINIAAGTGIGKTSLVNEMIYHWVFHSPHKIGIVSMELDAGQYGETLLSRHIQKKIALIKDDAVKQRMLTSDEVKNKAHELFFDGEEHRFYLLDNRDGSIEEIQDTIEELVISCGCKIVVLDPLQDILDGLTNEEQALFMKWSKGIIKSHGVSLIFINHVRKSPSGAASSSNGGKYSEEEIQGSSTIIKSASANILLSRDKTNDDPIIRNTTTIMLSKNRICGITGPAGEIYYDNETHTLHNKAEFLPDHH
jgi:twinkle protein